MTLCLDICTERFVWFIANLCVKNYWKTFVIHGEFVYKICVEKLAWFIANWCKIKCIKRIAWDESFVSNNDIEVFRIISNKFSEKK